MVKSRDISELKSRMLLDRHGLQLVRAFYVKNTDENQDFTEVYHGWFDNLEDDVREKVLYIIRELYSTKVGNNMVSNEFWEDSRAKHMLYECSMTKLKQDSSVEELMESILQHYQYVGNYMVLMVVDVYDVPGRNSAGEDQEESEEVYQSIAVAICPVNLEQPVLCVKEGVIQSKPRFWAFRKPAMGFIYPAFEERSADMDKIMVYISKPLEPDHTFLECGLEMKNIMTHAEIVKAFDRVMLEVAEDDKELKERYMASFCMKLVEIFPEEMRESADMSIEDVLNVAREAGMEEYRLQELKKEYAKYFGKYLPKVADLLNEKYILSAQEMEKVKRRKSLFRKAAEFVSKHGNEDLAGKLYQAAGTDSVLLED